MSHAILGIGGVAGMTITFYNTPSPSNMVTKQLNYISGFNNIVAKADIDILNPVIIMKFGDEYTTGINYMYIEDFKRYYFIDGVKAMTGGRVEIKGKVDVLMTYSHYIRNLYLTINQQRNIGNLYLPQTQPILEYQKTITKEFTTPFYQNVVSFILTVLGG